MWRARTPLSKKLDLGSIRLIDNKLSRGEHVLEAVIVAISMLIWEVSEIVKSDSDSGIIQMQIVTCPFKLPLLPMQW
jgi:hypothetical protein